MAGWPQGHPAGHPVGLLENGPIKMSKSRDICGRMCYNVVMTKNTATTNNHLIGVKRPGHFGLDDLVRLLESNDGRETLYELRVLAAAK